MSSTLEVIAAELDNGSTLPLRVTQSKAGNTYWAVLNSRKDGSRYNTPYGVNVSAAVVGSELPTKVTVLGNTFDLISGMSSPQPNPKTGKAGKARQQLKAEGKVNVPGHGAKVFTFRVSILDDGLFNVAASINGERAKGGHTHVLDEL